MSDLGPLARWRLVLGEAADTCMGGALNAQGQAMDAALSWLYDRDQSLGERDVASRQGGSGASTLSVPDWISEVHRLFPQETIERLEQDAIERYQIEELVTRADVLERVQPSEVLLQAVLRTKHLMNPEVLALARKLVAEVVRQLMDKLAREVKQAFAGTIDRRRRSLFKIARNLAFRQTLRENLHRWDPKTRRLYLEKPVFFSRTKRHTEKWQVILLVDQSGSMVSSVIHSAVTAACLWGLPGVRTHLVAFDTEVVDLTSDVTDPVELLMKVQLGGGTDIQKAVGYAQELVETPRRAIVVLITDFYEGSSPEMLVRRVAALTGQGTKVLGLAALDEHARPEYDRDLAARLVKVGAHVAAMTPGQLAAWIAEKVRA
ncbi:MAG: VWA domain-containing protein [Sandaracinus sp.]|nr:VWA domain-containing protein [Sandaracinus sp.]MCB9612127.1 VWA domain-containing protein [Sandaracinus sp.]MCB9636275.1 VWA domain-containing protein [Sandaracinus sp.]